MSPYLVVLWRVADMPTGVPVSPYLVVSWRVADMPTGVPSPAVHVVWWRVAAMPLGGLLTLSLVLPPPRLGTPTRSQSGQKPATLHAWIKMHNMMVEKVHRPTATMIGCEAAMTGFRGKWILCTVIGTCQYIYTPDVK